MTQDRMNTWRLHWHKMGDCNHKPKSQPLSLSKTEMFVRSHGSCVFSVSHSNNSSHWFTTNSTYFYPLSYPFDLSKTLQFNSIDWFYEPPSTNFSKCQNKTTASSSCWEMLIEYWSRNSSNTVLNQKYRHKTYLRHRRYQFSSRQSTCWTKYIDTYLLIQIQQWLIISSIYIYSFFPRFWFSR